MSSAVGGTCPEGSWTDADYTTGAITEPCDVSFAAVLNTYQILVSGDAQESITPDVTQMVDHGSTQVFTVNPIVGHTVSSTVGGTCPAGSWTNADYMTGIITEDCTVSFSATLNTYQVTVTGDGLVTMTPDTTQTANHGSTLSYTVAAMPDFALALSVGGTCADGSWNGSIYTTGAIDQSCEVVFGVELQCGFDPTCTANDLSCASTCADSQICDPFEAGECVAPQYTVPGDGTVIDEVTGLIWQQVTPSAPCPSGLGGRFCPLEEAETYCETLQLGGVASGWRLPTIQELHSVIIDGNSPAMEVTAFGQISSDNYLSSTPVHGQPGFVWAIYFAYFNNLGIVSPLDGASGNFSAIRCVR